MDRIFRRLSIFFFAAALLTLLVHATALVLRLSMDIRHVFPVDYLATLIPAAGLSGNDALIVFLLSNGVAYGIVSQVCFLLSQLMLELHDVGYMKQHMPENIDTQLKIINENEKALWGLLDRVIPLGVLIAYLVVLVGEWQRFGFLLTNPDYVAMTRRAIILPAVTAGAVGWALTVLGSLLISLLFLRYFRRTMIRLYEENTPKVGDA